MAGSSVVEFMKRKKPDEKIDTLEKELAMWAAELKAARKREDDYRKDGERILSIYDGSKADEVPFNILFSNTETLLPAIYSAIPRPVVDRRFKDSDPIGKAAATAATRILTFLVDTNVDGYETFDEGMTAATLNALLPGRGETRVKYDADMTEVPPASPVDTSEDDDAPEVAKPAYTNSELICCDSIDWNRVLYGYAKKWNKVPWIAYEEYIDKAEAVRLFDKAIVEQLPFTVEEPDADGEGTRRTKDEKDRGERKVTRIYQIWDKDGGRKVRYFSDHVKDSWLKVVEDPLQLAGFFNCPRPIQFIKKTHSLVPAAPYRLYESQAKELNELTRRIKMVAKAIKAKGIYDGSLGDDIKKLLEADDNELVPADNASSLAAEKGLQNAIWFMPVEQLIVVLTQLYQAREACKATIFEITGISDILRGATAASETATAQTIKNQWGTLRLKRAQKEVARYARDILRLMLELAASKFSEETWAKMTGLPFLLQPQVQQLTMQAQAMQMQPPTPESQQQMQQVQQQLQAPQWQQVLALLQDDLSRSYRIDIETNSTVEPEATEDQKQISELFTAIGQFLNGVGPLVAQGVMPFQVAQTMLLTIVRRFRFGTEIEEMIMQMVAPKPPDENGDAKAQAQQQQMQMQAEQEKGKLDMAAQKADMALQVKTMQAEKALLEKKIDLELREMQLKSNQEKFTMSQQAAEHKMTAQAQVHEVKRSADDKVRTLKDQSSKQVEQHAKTADSTLGSGVKELKGLVAELVKTVREQSARQEQTIQTLVKGMNAPRTRKAIRDKQGRIESVEESIAA